MESVREGKDLLERLYAFQVPRLGNFPNYLHEYPRCYSSIQPLRIAPILLYLLKHFHQVLDPAFKRKTRSVLKKLLDSASCARKEKPFAPIWERRYQAILGNLLPLSPIQKSQECIEELISNQMMGQSADEIVQLIHPILHVYTGPSSLEEQDKNVPKATLLDQWSNQCIRSSDLQILSLAILDLPDSSHSLWSGSFTNWHVVQDHDLALSYIQESNEPDRLALRLIWKSQEFLHSLVIPTLQSRIKIEPNQNGLLIYFDLPSIYENDSMEIQLFCDISKDTTVFIENKRATVFYLGQTVSLQTQDRTVRLQFEGLGEYCGQILRGNRPFQTNLETAHDWMIALRTLKRSSSSQLTLHLSYS